MHRAARGLNVAFFLAMECSLLVPGIAQAHRLRAECHVLPGNRVQVEGWFDRDTAPEGADVRVTRADGSLLAAGNLDAQGVYVFAYERPESLKVAVSDGQGHVAEVRLSASRAAYPP